MKAPLHVMTSVILTTLLIQSSIAQQAISPYVVASGGAFQSGTPNSLAATIGQPIAGVTDRLLAGFWYTLASQTETSMEEGQSDPSIPATFRLHQNYPNPFNPSTTITYELPSASNVSIRIVDALGRLISDRYFRNQAPGVHTMTWDARDGRGALVPSGTYWYRVQAGTASLVKMMVLLK